MSAIWGYIDLSGADIDQDIPDRMSKCTYKYRIDHRETFFDNNVYMACGLQYINKESRCEKMPFVKEDIYFTADVILDNRQQLISETSATESATDGELLFKAWKKWGDDFGDHVLGLFSFAVYDKRKNEFRLYTDHLSNRCIHYYVDGSKVFFSTLTSSITDTVPGIEICEKWMSASLITDYAYCFLFDGLTPFEGMHILPYGTGVVFKNLSGNVSVNNFRYYDPLSHVEQMKEFDDEKCRELFRTTFIKCVRDVVRTDGECGILLSGGLDSTSVGSIAAEYLSKDNKNLYSYTSVPIKDFVDEFGSTNGYYVTDETKDVMDFCKYYPNIKPSFIACEGENLFTHVDEACDYLELPYKALINHVWMHNSYAKAHEQGVKILLSGASGNDTISYGKMENTLAKLIKGFHFVECYKQFKTYTDKERIIKKRYAKRFLKELFCVRERPNIYCDNKGYKKELIDRFNSKSEWEKVLQGTAGFIRTNKGYGRCLFATGILQLLGIINTKAGLYFDVMMRDPTMDKRILELCLTLPYKAFAWNGVERRLIREYLDDYVPDEIRLNTRFRGKQSADAVLRLNRFGISDEKKLSDAVSDKLGKYYDLERVKEEMDEPNKDENLDWKAKIVSCSIFLDKYAK